MARSDLLVSLVKAGSSGDTARARSVAEAIIAEERVKRHNVLADRLTDAMRVNGADSAAAFLSSDQRPHRRFLAELTPRKKLADLVLTDVARRACEELIDDRTVREPETTCTCPAARGRANGSNLSFSACGTHSSPTATPRPSVRISHRLRRSSTVYPFLDTNCWTTVYASTILMISTPSASSRNGCTARRWPRSSCMGTEISRSPHCDAGSTSAPSSTHPAMARRSGLPPTVSCSIRSTGPFCG